MLTKKAMLFQTPSFFPRSETLGLSDPTEYVEVPGRRLRDPRMASSALRESAAPADRAPLTELQEPPAIGTFGTEAEMVGI